MVSSPSLKGGVLCVIPTWFPLLVSLLIFLFILTYSSYYWLLQCLPFNPSLPSTAFLLVLLTPALVLVQSGPPGLRESTPLLPEAKAEPRVCRRQTSLPRSCHHRLPYFPLKLNLLLYLPLRFTFWGVTHLCLAFTHNYTASPLPNMRLWTLTLTLNYTNFL